MQVAEKEQIIKDMIEMFGYYRANKFDKVGKGVKIWIRDIKQGELDRLHRYLKYRYITVHLCGDSDGVRVLFTSTRGSQQPQTQQPTGGGDSVDANI